MLHIYLADTAVKANRYLSYITDNNISVVGLDTEKTLASVKNASNQTDTIQLCIQKNNINIKYETKYKLKLNHTDKEYISIIIQLSIITDHLEYKNTYSTINKILLSGNIIKVGCAVYNDLKSLKKDYNLEFSSWIDTQYIVKSVQSDTLSLDKLGTNLLGSNKYVNTKSLLHKSWSDNLDKEQIIYSAYDAYLSLVTYTKLIDTSDLNIVNTLSKTNNNTNTNNTDNNTIDGLNYDDIHKFMYNKTFVFKGHKNTNKNILINILINSYNITAHKYTREEIKVIVDDMIKYWINKSYIIYKEDIIINNHTYNDIEENINIDKMKNIKISFDMNSIIKDIKIHFSHIYSPNGMTKKSILNVIQNSFLSKYKYKVIYSNTIFQQCITSKYLVIYKNRYKWI